jgi:hypothetical protein
LNRDKNELFKDFEKDLETLTKWLSDSGLKVNENTTKLVLLYRNILGVVFDSKFQWAQHEATTVT